MPEMGIDIIPYRYADRWYVDRINKDQYIYRYNATYMGFSSPVRFTGAVHMGSNRIGNLADPISAAQATTKSYVDDAIDTDISTHKDDADAHHPEEIPEGRGYYGTTTLLSVPGCFGVGMSTQGLVANRIYYFPIHVRTPITIDQVTIEVTTEGSAGEKCKIAIYAVDSGWQPLARLVASADIAIEAQAVIDTAITETTLQEGNNLVACTVEGNVTLRTLKYGLPLMGFVPTLGASSQLRGFYVAASYAALPDPGTAWDTPDATTESIKPFVFLRVKTP